MYHHQRSVCAFCDSLFFCEMKNRFIWMRFTQMALVFADCMQLQPRQFCDSMFHGIVCHGTDDDAGRIGKVKENFHEME